MPRDYYEVLGVNRDAGEDEIRKAYKRLAIKFHPDKSKEADAEAKFKEASEAYEVLSNAETRARYDRFGHEGVRGVATASSRSVQDIFSSSTFADIFADLFGGGGGGGGIFDAFFGGGGGRHGGPRARKGPSIRGEVVVNLEDTLKETVKEVTYNRHETCETCHGSGAKEGSGRKTCSTCQGRGVLVQQSGFIAMQRTCPTCAGEGQMLENPCKSCDGVGFVPKRTTESVAIPPGIDDGMRIAVRGKGEPGENGGPRGDLLVDVRIRPHKVFFREGDHVVLDLPVTYTQLALGASVDVPTLTGEVTLKIPAGTQPGGILRVRGQGIPDINGRGRGDQLVRVMLEVPKSLPKRMKSALQDLSALEAEHPTPRQREFKDATANYQSSRPKKG